MNAEFIRIHPDNPQDAKLERVVECLRNGGLVIYPTDTVYGIGCDVYNAKAIERLRQLKGVKEKDLKLSFICYDLSDISQYARVETPIFKRMKRALPGPFTIILESSNKFPKIFQQKKKQVGIRVPDNAIVRELVKRLESPLANTSIKAYDEEEEYDVDPELIFHKYQKLVDIVIDGGYGNSIPSTVIDCSSDEPELIREGLGDPELFME